MSPGRGVGLEIRVQALELREQDVGVLEQDRRRRREPDAAAVRLQQPAADVALERGELLGHRRRRSG